MVNPVPGYKVTTAYKKRGPYWSLGFHTGQDYAAPAGTPIVAGRPGKVISANAYDSSYGYKVIVEHEGEQDWYCHMPKGAATVKAGQQVTAGQRIGSVGATGNVTGPHLHLERRARPWTFAASSFRDPMAIHDFKPVESVPESKRYVVTAKGLNGRRGPGMGYEVAWVAPEGHRTVSQARTKDGEWVQSTAGYWYAAYYLREESKPQPGIEPHTGRYVVTASGLNGRRQPSTSAEVAWVAPKGHVTIAQARTTDGEWIQSTGGYWYASLYLRAEAKPPTPDFKLWVTTFNVADKLGTVAARLDAIARDILAENSDVVALQEATGRKGVGQASDFARAIHERVKAKYDLVIPTTDHNENYLLIKRSHVSFTQRPDLIVRAKSGGVGRHLTWGVVTKRDGSGSAVVGNYHLEHTKGSTGDKIRAEQAEIIASHLADHADGRPIVVMGDSNQHPPLAAFTKRGLAEVTGKAQTGIDLDKTTWIGEPDQTVIYTGGPGLDHIYTSGLVERARVVITRHGIRHKQPKPSDHAAKSARINLSKKG